MKEQSLDDSICPTPVLSNTEQVQPSPTKSPFRRLFSKTILPSSPSKTSLFPFGSLSSSTPSTAVKSSSNLLFGIHLFDYGTHSEIRFEQGVEPIIKEREFSTSTAYSIACTSITEKGITLTCKDDKGISLARSRTSLRGTEIKIINDSNKKIWLEEGDHSVKAQRIHADGILYQWATSTGLAILIDLQTRQKLARLEFNVLAKDKLIITTAGLGKIPWIIISAAQVWSEHSNTRDFRLN
ncbi:uncharacterized protein L201_000319 [Kwoniella dendrophila CBS 6074]|uniref:Uncharacterized protein n=1 Tax=Kwoniella dendrophila CBS 6074 TaxID=1295534 RepID=A0AAX4JJ26_9TREE